MSKYFKEVSLAQQIEEIKTVLREYEVRFKGTKTLLNRRTHRTKGILKTLEWVRDNEALIRVVKRESAARGPSEEHSGSQSKLNTQISEAETIQSEHSYLKARPGVIDYRVARIWSVLRTLIWVRDNEELIRAVKRELDQAGGAVDAA